MTLSSGANAFERIAQIGGSRDSQIVDPDVYATRNQSSRRVLTRRTQGDRSGRRARLDPKQQEGSWQIAAMDSQEPWNPGRVEERHQFAYFSTISAT